MECFYFEIESFLSRNLSLKIQLWFEIMLYKYRCAYII